MALVGPELSAREHPWSELGYLHHPGSEDDVKGISHWLIADFDAKVAPALQQLFTGVPVILTSQNLSSSGMPHLSSHACHASPPLVLCLLTCIASIHVEQLGEGFTQIVLQGLIAPTCAGTQAGQLLILAALEHLAGASAKGCRMAFVHNPTSASGRPDAVQLSLLSRSISAAAALRSRRPKIGPFLQTLLHEHTGAGLHAYIKTLDNAPSHLQCFHIKGESFPL